LADYDEALATGGAALAPELPAGSVAKSEFQTRDLRAKAGTDNEKKGTDLFLYAGAKNKSVPFFQSLFSKVRSTRLVVIDSRQRLT
jgi:hypothetical protein